METGAGTTRPNMGEAMTDTILLQRRMMPAQPQDSPFWLPSEGASPEGPEHKQEPNSNLLKHMPDISQMAESRFLKQADVGPGKLLTIESCNQQNVAKANEAAEMKWCLNFVETEKPLVLNRVNSELTAQITGERNSDDWGGHKVVLYADPSIMFGGHMKGGIRIRAPKNKTAPAQVKPPVKELPADEDSDDIPF